MRLDKDAMLLYAVTDRAWTGEMTLMEQVKVALDNGVTCIQLREKELSDEEFLREAIEMKELCHSYGVPFIINDNVEVAIKCGADGIHVGQEDMRCDEVRRRVGDDMIIGVSTHDVQETLEAIANGADYLGLGAAFSTNTKTDVDVMDAKVMRDITKASSVPSVAIGGISAKNILDLKGRGVDGVAVISAIFGAKDIASATKELRQLSEQMVKGNE